MQDDVTAQTGDVGVLDGWRARGHGDGGGDLELARRVGYALSVISWAEVQPVVVSARVLVANEGYETG